MNIRVIEGEEAKAMKLAEKWELLSPYLKQHGREVSWATLQDNMNYFIVEGMGYLAYVSVTHPVFAPKGCKVGLVDPLCAVSDYQEILKLFLKHCPKVCYLPVSKEMAAAARPLGFKANCIGYDAMVYLKDYNTRGDWKELHHIRRAHNEAKRHGITVREEPDISKVNREQLDAVSKIWLGSKVLKDREIWVYARNPVYVNEPDVRKFVAYDGTGKVAGFAFYDPTYRDGKIVGYCANTSRCDEVTYGKLSTVVHMDAAEVFKKEGIEFLNLQLAPFDKVEKGLYNDDASTTSFAKLSRKYGEKVYNFGGLAFFKSRFRPVEEPKYLISNAAMPSNDLYLAYWSSGITESYFKMVGDYLGCIVTGVAGELKDYVVSKFKKKPQETKPADQVPVKDDKPGEKPKEKVPAGE